MLTTDGKVVVMPNQFFSAPQTVGLYPSPPTTGRPESESVFPTTLSVPELALTTAAIEVSAISSSAVVCAVGASPLVSLTTISTGCPAIPPAALVAVPQAWNTLAAPASASADWPEMLAIRPILIGVP